MHLWSILQYFLPPVVKTFALSIFERLFKAGFSVVQKWLITLYTKAPPREKHLDTVVCTSDSRYDSTLHFHKIPRVQNAELRKQ